MSRAPIYRYEDVNFDNLEVTELVQEGNQPFAYIDMYDAKRNAKTKILVQNSGKIKINSQWLDEMYPNNASREYIKIPLDPEQPACMELRKHLAAADEWAGSEKMRKRLFGKRADKYQYQPCIKYDNSKNAEYVKMKFVIIEQGGDRVNKTALQRIEGDKKIKINAMTITQFVDEIRFLSEFKFIFCYSRIWANKVADVGEYMIRYGLVLKIMAINYEYIPNANISDPIYDLQTLKKKFKNHANDTPITIDI